jgi:hypothetical protein
MTKPNYHPKTLASMDQLLESGESWVYYSDWFFTSQVWVDATKYTNGYYRNVENGCTLGLTEERIYFMQFRIGFGGKRVSNHWARPYQNIINYQFNKRKSNKGATTGYQFIVQANDGIPNLDVYNKSENEAIEFQDCFKTGMARFTGVVASTPNFVEQISAMQQLHDQGVLSKEEFQRAKELFIGKAPNAEIEMQRTLLNLKQLKDAGVLTEAEYAAKKWTIISGDN